MKRKFTYYTYCVTKMKWPGKDTLYFATRQSIKTETNKGITIIKQFKYWDDAQTFANLMNIAKRVL